MTNEELLEKLHAIIREETEAEAERTRSANTMASVRMQAALGKIADRLKNLEISNKRLEQRQTQLEQGQKQTNKELAQLIQDMADFFHETWGRMSETSE